MHILTMRLAALSFRIVSFRIAEVEVDLAYPYCMAGQDPNPSRSSLSINSWGRPGGISPGIDP